VCIVQVLHRAIYIVHASRFGTTCMLSLSTMAGTCRVVIILHLWRPIMGGSCATTQRFCVCSSMLQRYTCCSVTVVGIWIWNDSVNVVFKIHSVMWLLCQLVITLTISPSTHLHLWANQFSSLSRSDEHLIKHRVNSFLFIVIAYILLIHSSHILKQKSSVEE